MDAEAFYKTHKKNGDSMEQVGPEYKKDMVRYVHGWLDSMPVEDSIDVVLSWFDSKELQEALRSRLD